VWPLSSLLFNDSGKALVQPVFFRIIILSALEQGCHNQPVTESGCQENQCPIDNRDCLPQAGFLELHVSKPPLILFDQKMPSIQVDRVGNQKADSEGEDNFQAEFDCFFLHHLISLLFVNLIRILQQSGSAHPGHADF
jgi:hypothetical protein